MHAMFFHPEAFKHFPQNKNGEDFIQKEEQKIVMEVDTQNKDGSWEMKEQTFTNTISFLVGNSIMEQMDEHFDCPYHKGGKV